MSVGIPLPPPCPDLDIFLDASFQGQGMRVIQQKVSGYWSVAERYYHINIMELLILHQTVEHFLYQAINCLVLIYSDNSTIVAYFSHQSGTCSGSLCILTLDPLDLLVWTHIQDSHFIVCHVLSVLLQIDFTSRQILVKQPLCPLVFQWLCLE